MVYIYPLSIKTIFFKWSSKGFPFSIKNFSAWKSKGCVEVKRLRDHLKNGANLKWGSWGGTYNRQLSFHGLTVEAINVMKWHTVYTTSMLSHCKLNNVMAFGRSSAPCSYRHLSLHNRDSSTIHTSMLLLFK